MSRVNEADLSAWRAAVGRTATRRQWLDPESARRFALAAGGDGATPSPLAHWAWFLDAVADDEIGADGHPRRGGFLPDIAALPRRMFASTLIRFPAPLEIGAEAEMTMRIADLRHKAGRSGDLVFVDVERTIAQGGAARVVETQTLVYRAAGETGPSALPVPAADAAEAPANGTLWTPGTVNLTRFSAVTFNGHRIHYDLPYARDVEGYPALIVHGPFIAAKLAALAARDGPLASFEFRAQAPAFVDQPIRLVAVGAGEFHAIRCDGTIATIVKATYR